MSPSLPRGKVCPCSILIAMAKYCHLARALFAGRHTLLDAYVPSGEQAGNQNLRKEHADVLSGEICHEQVARGVVDDLYQRVAIQLVPVGTDVPLASTSHGAAACSRDRKSTRLNSSH